MKSTNFLRKLIYNLKLLFLPCPENDHKIKFLHKNYFALCVIILICLKLFIIPIFIMFPQNVFFADISKIALINLINEERTKNNLCLLESNPILDNAAEYKAQDMLEYNYFEHTSPSGITPWHWFEKANYNYVFAGENLAIGFLESEEVYSAWMNSPSHKANLMNPDYKELGIAVIDGNFNGSQTSVIVQTFGSPSSPAIASADLKEEIQKPIEPIAPTEPTEPITPIEPIEPTEPVGPIGPITPITPITPIEKNNPSADEKTKTETEETIIVEKKVYGMQSSTQISSFVEQPQKNNIKFNIWKFMVMDYYGLVQKLILYLLFFGSLLVSLIFSFKTNALNKYLIAKTITLIFVLSVFYLIDKQSILQIIPHELII